MQFSSAGGDNDLVAGVNVQHAGIRAGDNQRARVDTNHILTDLGVKGNDVLPTLLRRRGCGLTGCPHADDNDITMQVAGGDLRAIGASCQRQRWVVVTMVTFDDHPRLRFDLTGAHIGDAIDRSETVRTVAGQAEATAASRMAIRPQQGDQHRVT